MAFTTGLQFKQSLMNGRAETNGSLFPLSVALQLGLSYL